MDLRREKKPVNLLISVLILLILAVVAGISFLIWGRTASPQSPSSTSQAESLEGADPLAQDGPLDDSNPFSGKSGEDEFYYRINRSLYFKSGEQKGSVKFENPSQNTLLLAVELELSDSGEVVYRSGYLRPDEHIAGAPLMRALPDGVYEATAYLHAIDPITLDLLETFEEPVMLYVGVKQGESGENS